MENLTFDTLSYIASLLDVDSMINLALTHKKHIELIHLAKSIIDKRSLCKIDKIITTCSFAMREYNNKKKRIQICIEIFENIQKSSLKNILYNILENYIYIENQSINVITVLEETIPILKLSQCTTYLGNIHKIVWSLYERLWFGDKFYINMSWRTKNQWEVNANISNDNMTLIKLKVINEDIQCVSFDIKDINGICKFIQSFTYYTFLEDANIELMLSDNIVHNPIVLLKRNSNLKSDINMIIEPINKLLEIVNY